ncbi:MULTISPECIES: DUF1648 domain-containing protein [unclassified Paenibacillus]|uniref:DUF1648 domain-containing protein n=1 Tax=unclassified Paenibacillus TaxID=185978 RepID=UPI001C10E64C|nr:MULTISPECIES: DUF1648 domain-containing protein [unclassified Paenibacillus]MBU5444434.1 DUF1648 domain-containing protein [Paenibacillus sp. MSJ-34]CAH0121313.1 hypothetical protein PAE9249_03840 [Paenibacillus sp. CECT 9249]
MKKWIVPATFAIAAAIISFVFYAKLPETMVIHFGSAEQPDNWLSKPFGAFSLPVLILIASWFVITVAKFEKDENKRRRVEASLGSMVATIAAALFAVHGFILAYNLGYELSAATFATVIVGILFLIVGNIIPRLPQGTMQWPKLPEGIRLRAFRFQGRLMVVMGIVFVLLGLLPGHYILPAFLVTIAFFALVTIGRWIGYART